jgi:DUF4097 and DUF4098 domain-containing protein YvlB
MFIRTVILSVALVFSLSANAEVTKEETFSFKISDSGSFSLSNVNGDVTVTGGDGNTIEVVATKKAGSQKQLDGIEIKISESADSVEIETDLPSSEGWFKWGNDGAEVTYEVTVPSGISLDSIETVNGEVEIRGVSGDVNASTVNGEINLEDLAADVEMDTVNGTINASFAKLEGQQKVKASTVNGRMTLNLPADADVDVNADTLNGNISADDFDLEVDKGFVGSDLNGKIGSGSASLNLDTVNGSIKIRKD